MLMDIKEIINKKASGKKLTQKEIEFFINGYTHNEIPDYQISALLMAIKLRGMTKDETFWLTLAMLKSGDQLSPKDIGFVVDKHSTGGISDTTTLAIAPICAVCGVPMLKLSGRGLGFTGGTIDKLEAFSGYEVAIDFDKTKKLLAKNGACVISASLNLAPADKKLYALRDCTSTVESLPLIASSIMSKKLASGASAIVLDIKYGNGAFMKTKKDAEKLARLMVHIGKKFGRKMDYALGDMNQPLGQNIGCKLEAYEAIEVLKGKQGDLYNSVLDLSAKCISLGKNISYSKALDMAENAVNSGLALEKFKQMVSDQGGLTKLFNGLDIKPKLSALSNCDGILTKVKAEKLGMLVGSLGASRKTISDSIDYNVGVKTFHRLGDTIKKGDVLFEIYAKSKKEAKDIENEFLDCYIIEQ